MSAHTKGLPINNTVKLPQDLQARVDAAMKASGFTIWAEFCRVALAEKCQKTEKQERDAKVVKSSVRFS